MFLDGTAFEDVLSAVRERHLFQYPTERKISRMARACWRRLEALGSEDLVREIVESPASTAKQINLYAIMRYNRLAWTFMVELIGERFRTLDFSLRKRDIGAFFSDLRAEDEVVASWTDSTVAKLKGVLVKMLVETDYIDNARSETLKPVLISSELERGIIANDDLDALPAFNRFR